MNDLIRREDALEAIVDDRTHTILQAWINVKKTVPSVDAVEVVRCKECKHNYNTAINHGKMNPRCDFMDVKLKPDDFCSYGERNDNEF